MLRSPRPQTPAPHPGSRSAFTLIELIVVILVIGILLAMLLPAINNVRVSARNAQVAVDIKNLEAAISSFKLKFGMEPPSSFLISNTYSDYTGTAVGRQSLQIMRQMWPSYSITNDATTPGGPNGMGVPNAKYLNGAECLTFFLGGVGMYNTTGKDACIPNGFSVNPMNPFTSTGSNRVGPFYEFDSARLVDTDNDSFFELLDTLPNQTMPYQYLSSYNGSGYQPLGADAAAGATASDLDNEVITVSGELKIKSAYLKNDKNWSSASDLPVAANTASNWNGKSFQIISPGYDGEFGIGGTFVSDKGIAIGSGNYRSAEARRPEVDNITNFASGVLGKTFTP